LKSAIATAQGLPVVVNDGPGEKAPVPVPNNSAIVAADELTTTMSLKPSSLMSPTAGLPVR
jgi:hypothetical protein